MKKRKNSERKYRKIILRVIFGSIIAVLFVLSTPTIYALLTYYYLPETYEKPPISKWYYGSDNPHEICVDVGYLLGYIFMPDAFKVRFVIDDEIVPLSQVHITILHHLYDPFDAGFPMRDIACITQSNLMVGKHEVIFFYGSEFQWYPASRWIIHVDESGMIR